MNLSVCWLLREKKNHLPYFNAVTNHKSVRPTCNPYLNHKAINLWRLGILIIFFIKFFRLYTFWIPNRFRFKLVAHLILFFSCCFCPNKKCDISFQLSIFRKCLTLYNLNKEFASHFDQNPFWVETHALNNLRFFSLSPWKFKSTNEH